MRTSSSSRSGQAVETLVVRFARKDRSRTLYAPSGIRTHPTEILNLLTLPLVYRGVKKSYGLISPKSPQAAYFLILPNLQKSGVKDSRHTEAVSRSKINGV